MNETGPIRNDALAMTAEEEAQIDDLVFRIVGKPFEERSEAETAVLTQASHMAALRQRILNLSNAYGNQEKALGLARSAGEQQAEIIGRFHDFCDDLERAVKVAEGGLLVGEVNALECVLSDARRAAGLDKDEENES